MKIMRPVMLSLALVLLVPATLPAQKTAGGTADLSAGPSWVDSYYQNVPTLTEAATKEGYSPLIKEFTKSCNDNAEALEETTKKVTRKVSTPTSKGMTREMRGRGNQLIQEGKQASGWYRRIGKWAEYAGKFLKAVDFVSTTAQAAGYLAEGDKTGATSVILNDVSKKTCSAGGAAALSGIPVVGQAAGAAAGEEFHNTYVKPLIDERENQVRNAEAKEKMLGKPWMPPNLAYNPDGYIYKLPDDRFHNPQTGRLDTRSPQEQAQYEREKRTEYQDGLRLSELSNQVLNGDITPDQYSRALSDYRKRDKSKPWKPPALGDEEREPQTTDAKPDGSETEDQDLKTGENEYEDDEEEEDEEEEEDTPPDDEEKQEKGGILDLVTPQQVKATGKKEEDYSAEGFTNIATTTFTLTFWNVGGLAKGYGGASLVTVTTFTMHPAVEKSTCSGFFYGGPDGSFVMNCDNESVSLRLRGGQTVSGGGLNLSVQNPGAFANWPKDR